MNSVMLCVPFSIFRMNSNDVISFDPTFRLFSREISKIPGPQATIVLDTFLAVRIRIGFIPS